MRPHAVTETSNGWDFDYDANGNMTSRTVTEGTYQLSYTWENQLAAITATTSMAVTRFFYDADGVLVKKVGPEGTTHYVGGYYEKNVTTDVATSYYTFGAQRVALTVTGTLSYLYADHLGSASLATDADGNVTAEMRYYPYGETRWTGTGSMPTDRRFTGQREEAGLGLYDYVARRYDPYISRWIQPDTIIPDPGNPQSLNRYTYVYGNPLRYIDPSGHDPLDGAWEQAFYEIHGSWPTDQDRRDRLFSLLFAGSGPGGSWSDEDWLRYHQNRDALWSGKQQWVTAGNPGVGRFCVHLKRLAAHYNPGEEGRYVQAVGFIWGGVPLGDPAASIWQMATAPGTAWSQYTPLYEGTAGWDARWVDDENPSHHYAGLFYLGYYTGSGLGMLGNWMRDGPVNFDFRQWRTTGVFTHPAREDLALGQEAVLHGWSLSQRYTSMRGVGTLVRGFAVSQHPDRYGRYRLD